MINENMKKVLVALRSGEYAQAEGTLQNSCGLIVGGKLTSHPRGLFQCKNKNPTFLAALNDLGHHKYIHIADFIESDPNGLLV
jgi:hypothetical protein